MEVLVLTGAKVVSAVVLVLALAAMKLHLCYVVVFVQC